MNEHIAELRRLEAEIEASIQNPEDPLDDANELVIEHQKRLESLFADLGEQKPEGELLEALRVTQQKLLNWTEKAQAEQQQAKSSLLKLAQGRKAKKQY